MHDEYAHAVETMLDAKISEKARLAKAARPRPARAEPVADLLSTLQEAADRARANREKDAAVHHMAGLTADPK
ncbi:hypothetical protein [Actinacidiphila rubida]|nr:hypothetical protein [Actinacidiphila rubida]